MVTIDEAAERKALRNPPAFPVDHRALMQGMTLRDYFAAKALPSVLDQNDVHDGRLLTNVAWTAYRMADAMLKARAA